MTKAPMNDLPTLLVMAAGLSRRFSAGPKLLADFGGRPLLAATMARLASVEADARLCVVPPGAAEIVAVAEAYGYQPIVNPEPAHGLGASLAWGSVAAPDDRSLLVCLGDMPFVSPEHIRRVIDAQAGAGLRSVATTRLGGHSQPPTVFGSGLLPLLRTLDGDAGAKPVFAEADRVIAIEGDPSKLGDIDTTDDLARLSPTES